MAVPSLPPQIPGKYITLDNGERIFARTLAGPPGAPVVVLHHGWGATADLNWATSQRALKDAGFTSIAVDLRGHGRGIHSRQRVTAKATAGDTIRMLDALGIDKAIVVGYSWGGAVALTAATTPEYADRVSGVVACMTAAKFPRSTALLGPMWLGHIGLGFLPARFRRVNIPWRTDDLRTDNRYRKRVLGEVSGNDARAMAEVGVAIARHNLTGKLSSITKPTAVVAAPQDHLVPIAASLDVAMKVPGATSYLVDAPSGHLAAGLDPGAFVPRLVEACKDVWSRIQAADAASPAGPACSVVGKVVGRQTVLGS